MYQQTFRPSQFPPCILFTSSQDSSYSIQLKAIQEPVDLIQRRKHPKYNMKKTIFGTIALSATLALCIHFGLGSQYRPKLYGPPA